MFKQCYWRAFDSRLTSPTLSNTVYVQKTFKHGQQSFGSVPLLVPLTPAHNPLFGSRPFRSFTLDIFWVHQQPDSLLLPQHYPGKIKSSLTLYTKWPLVFSFEIWERVIGSSSSVMEAAKGSPLPRWPQETPTLSSTSRSWWPSKMDASMRTSVVCGARSP